MPVCLVQIPYPQLEPIIKHGTQMFKGKMHPVCSFSQWLNSFNSFHLSFKG